MSIYFCIFQKPVHTHDFDPAMIFSSDFLRQRLQRHKIQIDPASAFLCQRLNLACFSDIISTSLKGFQPADDVYYSTLVFSTQGGSNFGGQSALQLLPQVLICHPVLC